MLRPVRSYILAIFWYFLGPSGDHQEQLIQILIVSKKGHFRKIIPNCTKPKESRTGQVIQEFMFDLLTCMYLSLMFSQVEMQFEM